MFCYTNVFVVIMLMNDLHYRMGCLVHFSNNPEGQDIS